MLVQYTSTISCTTSTIYLYITPVHYTCTLHLYTTPVHYTCTPVQYSSTVHYTCTTRLYMRLDKEMHSRYKALKAMCISPNITNIISLKTGCDVTKTLRQNIMIVTLRTHGYKIIHGETC